LGLFCLSELALVLPPSTGPANPRVSGGHWRTGGPKFNQRSNTSRMSRVQPGGREYIGSLDRKRSKTTAIPLFGVSPFFHFHWLGDRHAIGRQKHLRSAVGLCNQSTHTTADWQLAAENFYRSLLATIHIVIISDPEDQTTMQVLL
jgi:hypothetical protein